MCTAGASVRKVPGCSRNAPHFNALGKTEAGRFLRHELGGSTIFHSHVLIYTTGRCSSIRVAPWVRCKMSRCCSCQQTSDTHTARPARDAGPRGEREVISLSHTPRLKRCLRLSQARVGCCSWHSSSLSREQGRFRWESTRAGAWCHFELRADNTLL